MGERATEEEQQANAQHIVHCVNSHDALVEALENLTNEIHRGRKYDVRNSNDFALLCAEAAASKALALAKAEETP